MHAIIIFVLFSANLLDSEQYVIEKEQKFVSRLALAHRFLKVPDRLHGSVVRQAFQFKHHSTQCRGIQNTSIHCQTSINHGEVGSFLRLFVEDDAGIFIKLGNLQID